jgi:hypothetical protein
MLVLIHSRQETSLLKFVRRRSATWHIAQRPALAPTISGVSADLHLTSNTIPRVHTQIKYTQRYLNDCPSLSCTKPNNLPESPNRADRVGACVSLLPCCTWASVASLWRYTLKENYLRCCRHACGGRSDGCTQSDILLHLHALTSWLGIVWLLHDSLHLPCGHHLPEPPIPVGGELYIVAI